VTQNLNALASSDKEPRESEKPTPGENALRLYLLKSAANNRRVTFGWWLPSAKNFSSEDSFQNTPSFAEAVSSSLS
jgi:hypothetical protein